MITPVNQPPSNPYHVQGNLPGYDPDAWLTIYVCQEYAKYNDDVYPLTYTGTTTATYPIAFFGARRGSQYVDVTPLDVQYCMIWDDGNLVRNFVPMFDDSLNKAGMFDIVQKKFYSSAVSQYSFELLTL